MRRLRPLLPALLLATACASTRGPSPAPLPAAVAREAGADPVIAAAPPPADAGGPGGGDAAAEMARKLQNPLANIKALITDNTIGFDTGFDKGTSFAFQLQPVYAFDVPDRGFTFIPRAVIPFMGLEPGTDAPIVGQPSGSGSRAWGLGDSAFQAIFAPHTEGKWKWGAGPQVTLPTATDSQLRGPGWGGGIAGVVTGEFTPELSTAIILGNTWSFDREYNTLTLQPMFFYNVPGMPGTAISYNAVISADWEAPSGNTWTIPLGLSVSRTFDMGNGNGFDVSAGVYYNVVRPDGAAGWQFRFGLVWVFP